MRNDDNILILVHRTDVFPLPLLSSDSFYLSLSLSLSNAVTLSLIVRDPNSSIHSVAVGEDSYSGGSAGLRFGVRGERYGGGGGGRGVRGEGWGREGVARDEVFPLAAAAMEVALPQRTVKGQGKEWSLKGIFSISTKKLTVHSRNADSGGKCTIL